MEKNHIKAFVKKTIILLSFPQNLKPQKEMESFELPSGIKCWKWNVVPSSVRRALYLPSLPPPSEDAALATSIPVTLHHPP